LIGIFPTLYIDIARLVSFFTRGYLETYRLGLNSFIYTLSIFSEIGIIMLLISNKYNKRKAKWIFIFALTYLVLTMMSGNRGRQIVVIVTMVYVYFNFIKPIKLRNLMKYSIFGYLGLVFLNSITSLRQLQNPSIAIFINNFISGLFGSTFFNTLGEFGGTIITLSYSIMYFPSYSPFQFGKNYIYSLLSIFPNIGGILNEVNRIVFFTSLFPSDARRFLGGSYIAELYASFGEWGFIFSIFIGIGIGYLSISIKKAIITKEYILLSILLILFPGVLWWVRGYFSTFIREFVWISFVIILINTYLKDLQKRKKRL